MIIIVPFLDALIKFFKVLLQVVGHSECIHSVYNHLYINYVIFISPTQIHMIVELSKN